MDEKTKTNKTKQKNVETMKTSSNAELEKAKTEAKTYLEMAQRITAEFENYKKRNAELAKQSEDMGIVKAVTKFLPCIDAFDNAFKMISDEGTKEGLNLVYEQIINALKDLGIEEIEALGLEFDPDFHNAVIATEDSENAGKVLEVYQKGFKAKDRVIRYSMVRVGK